MPQEYWHPERLRWQTERLREAHSVQGALKLVTAPAVEPMDLIEAKTHCSVDPDLTADDAMLSDYITSARAYLEARTHRVFITQTWDYAIDWFPSGNAPVLLPLAPLLAVTSVTSYSLANAPTVLSSSTYFVDTTSEPGRVALNDGQTWPVDGLRLANAGVFRFTAGYGPTAADVPQGIRQAMRILVGHWYRNRETTQDGRVTVLDFTVDALIGPYVLCRS